MPEYKLVENALGRKVPTSVNGKEQVPYKGIDKFIPQNKKTIAALSNSALYPNDGNKTVKDLKTALQKAGIKNGMTVFVCDFLTGNAVVNQVFTIAKQLGIKDLIWLANDPCELSVKHAENGVIDHIEGNLNKEIAKCISQGKMKGTAILRSSGGIHQAIQNGEINIDIAIVAVATADMFGNGNGIYENFPYANKIILVADHLTPFPCYPCQIQGNYVDHVVIEKMAKLPKIVSSKITKDPDHLLAAQMTMDFLLEAGILKEGFSLQTGAKEIPQAFAILLQKFMAQQKIKARFICSQEFKYLTSMLEQKLTDYIFDNKNIDYNYHNKGNIASMIDVAILGATQVDVNFNANIVTDSDGSLRGGLDQWQSGLFSKCTIVPMLSFCDRIPAICDHVTTICGPGELVDVVVTERGIAINPKRKDLLEKMKSSKLPFCSIKEIKDQVEKICGKPQSLKFDKKIVAAVKWVDGTVIDCIYKQA